MFFRLPTAIALCLVVLPICALSNINLDKRWPQTIVMIGIVAGAMFLPVVFQERFVANYLTGHGYSRCAARDHRIGHGKSSVWFDAYVLNPADCPAE
jgi:predicted histidine transporter YuiF (NhaC family)